ncbi:MAG: hypothetical protein HY819_20120 [Acidobacteria bacterium]|nr:hypothetical protein [Acidobacteriota bacterium]
MKVPELIGTDGTQLLRQAIAIVKASNENAKEKADLFEKLASQITEKTKGAWNATRGIAVDGSHVFWGTLAQVLVINLQGELWRGDFQSGGISITVVNKEPRYQLNYARLRVL